MVEFFVDSGELKEIKAALETGVITGVTTNPGILSGIGVKNNIEHAKLIREAYPIGHLSVEVTEIGGYSDALYDATEILYQVKNVTVKIPLHPEWGLQLIHYLSECGSTGFSVNATCLMTARQALLSEAAGAEYVSLFYNRIIDCSTRDAAQMEIKESARLLSSAKLICGSIRRSDDVWECVDAGADIVTIPYKFLSEVLESRRHSKTDEAIKEFDEKWRKA